MLNNPVVLPAYPSAMVPTYPTTTYIKSIQRGVVVFIATDTSKTVTVTAVNPAKATLTLLGVITSFSAGADVSMTSFKLNLASATTIFFERFNTQAGMVANVSWELIEWN